MSFERSVGWLERADAALETGHGEGSVDRQQLQDVLDAIAEVPPLRQRVHELVHALARGWDVAITLMHEDLTTTQAAERLGCSRKIVNKMIEAGTLAAYRLPESDHQRIPAREVLRVLRERDELFWAPLTDLPGPEAFEAALAESRERLGVTVNGRRRR